MSKKIKEDYTHNDPGISGQYKTWFLDYASYVILGAGCARSGRWA